MRDIAAALSASILLTVKLLPGRLYSAAGSPSDDLVGGGLGENGQGLPGKTCSGGGVQSKPW